MLRQIQTGEVPIIGAIPTNSSVYSFSTFRAAHSYDASRARRSCTPAARTLIRLPFDDSLPRPRLIGQAPEHQHGAAPHRFELFQQIAHGRRSNCAAAMYVVLFEARAVVSDRCGRSAARDRRKCARYRSCGRPPRVCSTFRRHSALANRHRRSRAGVRASQASGRRALPQFAVRHKVHVAAEVAGVFGGRGFGDVKVRHT